MFCFALAVSHYVIQIDFELPKMAFNLWSPCFRLEDARFINVWHWTWWLKQHLLTLFIEFFAAFSIQIQVDLELWPPCRSCDSHCCQSSAQCSLLLHQLLTTHTGKPSTHLPSLLHYRNTLDTVVISRRLAELWNGISGNKSVSLFLLGVLNVTSQNVTAQGTSDISSTFV